MEAKKDQTTCQALRVIVSDSQVSQSQGRLCPSLFNQKEQPVFHQLIVTVLLSAMFPHWLSWAWWKQGNVTCQFFFTLVLVPVHVWEHKGLLAVCSCMFQASWSPSFQESSCFSPPPHTLTVGILGLQVCVTVFGFSIGSGIWTHVLSLVWHVLYPLTHFPALWDLRNSLEIHLRT